MSAFPTTPVRPTILWHSPGQFPLLRAVTAAAGLRVIGVGSPDSTLAIGLARQWESDATQSPDGKGSGGSGGGVQPLSDLRAALATAERGTLLLIADPGSFGAPTGLTSDRTTARLDVEELDNAEARGVKVVCIEPLPASLNQLTEAGIKVGDGPSGGGVGSAPGEWAFLAPLSRFIRPLQELQELLPTLGAVRSLSICCAGTPAHGSLGARLFDAADIAIMLLGSPETVHAVYTTPSTARGTHAAPPPPDNLRGLDGDLAVTLRYAGNRAATICVSNRAAGFDLSLSMLTADVSISIVEGALSVSRVSEAIDHEETVRTGPTTRDRGLYVRALAGQIGRYLDSGVGLAGRVDFAATLALAQAALLSARTYEPESPSTMLKLAGL